MSHRGKNDSESPDGLHLSRANSSTESLANASSNFLLSRHTSTSNTTPNANSNYISLSKLKNYMPSRKEPTTRFFTKYPASLAKPQHQGDNNYLPILALTQRTRNYSSFFNSSGQIQTLDRQPNKTRLDYQVCKKLNFSIQEKLGEQQEVGSNKVDRQTPQANHQQSEELAVVAEAAAAVAAASTLNQLKRSVTQQDSEQSQTHSGLSSNSQSASTRNSSRAKSFEEVESSGTINRRSHFEREPQPRRRQHPPVNVSKVERKRGRIDSLTTYLGFKEIQSKSDAISKTVEISCGKNNMTPSSLLLIHDRNYIERQHQLQQQQQQQRSEQEQVFTNYNDRIAFDESLSAAGIGVERENINRQRANENAKFEAVGYRGSSIGSAIVASSSLNCKPSSSSPTFMLSDTNQCKITANQNSNSSNDCSDHHSNNNNSKATTSSVVNKSNFSGTSSYLPSPHDDKNRTLNHRPSSNLLDSFSAQSNFQPSYNHQGLTSYEGFRNNNRLNPTQFVHYDSLANQHSIEGGSYFRSATQQVRSGDTTSNDNTSMLKVESVSLNSINDPGRNNFSQHQNRKSVSSDRYYRDNNQFNLMPTPSSKASSPRSDTPTPPHSTGNAMQTLSVAHNTTERLLSVGLTNNSTASESHADHLNHAYASGVALGHHTNQVSQHYSYNHQPTVGPNQHQLNIATHDQVYAQQQHQQQQHQHQQQHLQHHQSNVNSQHQSVYHQITTSSAVGGGGGGGGGSVNSGYSHPGTGIQYHGHLQAGSVNHQSSNLISEAHQSHLNTAAAARAAAAVVSQTLKTVANQHNQNHHGSHQQQYGGHLANGFGSMSESTANLGTQHHQQLYSESPIGHHHNHLSQVASLHQHHHQQQPHHHNGTNHNYHLHHNQQHHQVTQLQSNRAINQVASIVSRKYQCKMCPQVFMSKAEMKYHNQNHMREAKPYKCLQCPKAFANSSYLSQHMRIHQGVKPYTCDICTRKFTQLSHLQQHKRTHTGDKPYKCQYPNCTKQFSQLSNLQSHSRCHQLDKPYKCNSCYKCFQDEPSLLEHIPRHLESKHLKKNLCIFCGSSYQQERGLVKHFQQYHTDKTPTLVAAAIGAGTTGNTNLIASLISSSRNGVFATPSSGSTTSSSISSTCSTISSANGSGGGGGGGATGISGAVSNSHGDANVENSVNGAAISSQTATGHVTACSTGGYHSNTSFF